MKIENIDIQATIEKAKTLIRDDEQLSAATKSMFEILILVITLLANRLNLNSTNSSKPPSTDPNRKKQSRKTKKGQVLYTMPISKHIHPVWLFIVGQPFIIKFPSGAILGKQQHSS